MAGKELQLRFNNPLKENRTPDIIVQPVYGTIYTTSTKKIADGCVDGCAAGVMLDGGSPAGAASWARSPRGSRSTHSRTMEFRRI